MMPRKNVRRSLNSGITSIVKPLKSFLVVRTEEVNTGIQMGKRRKDKRKVFSSENITRLETKEPANEIQTVPRK